MSEQHRLVIVVYDKHLMLWLSYTQDNRTRKPKLSAINPGRERLLLTVLSMVTCSLIVSKT